MFLRRKKSKPLSFADKEKKDRKYIEKLIGYSEKDIRNNKYLVPEVNDEILKRRKVELAVKLIIPPALLFIVLTQVILIAIVPSSSMVPTLGKGDITVSNRLSYVAHNIERGDVVLFIKNSSFYVKRVVGLSGDTISLHDGSVYVNGVLFDEPYISDAVKTYAFKDGNNMTTYTVPRGYIFVLGDNREHSADSRYWTNSNGEPTPFVNEKNVKAKLLFSLSTKGFSAATSYRFDDIPLGGGNASLDFEADDSDFSYLVKPDVSTSQLETEGADLEETLPINKETTEEFGISENN